MKTTSEQNKKLVLEAFDTLFNKRDYAAAEKFWSPKYIQHSAHIPPGREGLFNLVKASPSALKYEHGLIMADGDYVFVHGKYSNTGLPVNWIIVDIVRVENGILAEHWDVIQDEATREQSKSGMPMFGTSFPKSDQQPAAAPMTKEQARAIVWPLYEGEMTTKQLNVERVCYVSRKTCREVLAVLDAGVGHPDMKELWRNLSNASTVSEVDEVMRLAVGSSGLIEFLRFDHGSIVQKGRTGSAPANIRLVVGNPSIMRRMVEHVPDAGSYAPVTILIDERPDGVHLSYDRMATFLGSYASEQALKVTRELDAKVERLLASAAN